ncbi:class I SAM-dependent methyltransferase [Microbacterium sp. CFH 31415]|uniref:class I SAM-dependent methyltransferase n=1 Tax=Microbacterium sp. CFH 31415 TaxID=2921732 RepID=UPI001F13D1D6|nr:class I SAM-dependent methyltransferase [Microbacterium sp. CFH 31415]MCH6231030.1 class I SAM-dependent methyltransferase [Microbacterium sp. CFH 31415]
MSFDVAAEAYDRFMGRYSTPLAETFAEWARLPGHGRALDVGCGPGALLAVLSRRFGPDEVAGVDPSESFVAAAHDRHPWADVRHGMAEALPFEDDTFDAALASLVVHFMTDAAAGAREMVRVTRPGGVVAACVWDFPGRRAPQSTFFSALSAVVEGIDDETDRVGAASGDLVALLRGAGCTEVEESELSVAVDYAGFDEWWEPYTLGVSPAGRQLQALSEEQRGLVRERCVESMPAGPFTVTATAWAARGVVPR